MPGETDFGYFSGEGKFSFKTGTEYTGEWNQNQLKGKGIWHTPNEGTYHGEFSESKKVEKEHSHGMMVLYMKVSGRMTRCADKVHIQHRMV